MKTIWPKGYSIGAWLFSKVNGLFSCEAGRGRPGRKTSGAKYVIRGIGRLLLLLYRFFGDVCRKLLTSPWRHCIRLRSVAYGA